MKKLFAVLGLSLAAANIAFADDTADTSMPATDGAAVSNEAAPATTPTTDNGTSDTDQTNHETDKAAE